MSTTKPKRLPLHIDCEIMIRSLQQSTLKARSVILGARHGEFILIQKPVFMISDRLSADLEGDFICSFFHDGDVYRFQSKVKKILDGDLAFIAYPPRFQVEQVRRHHRIQVNMEARIHLEETKEVFRGTIHDISEGGCGLILHAMAHITQNMPALLDFILPDNQVVRGMKVIVRAVQIVKMKQTIELGIQFVGPPQELAKVSAFCQYCMFFKV